MDYLNRFPQMMQQYLMRRVREAEAEGTARKAALKTRADALAYQADVRRKVSRVFGPLPRRTPLHPRVTGAIELDACRIEKVLFESRPGFCVTGLLYIPKRREFPCPAVLGACGHSEGGKSEDWYQRFCQGLASRGYVVFMYDPISQGERLQYPDGKGGSMVGSCCAEHNHAGNQQALVGDFFGTWRTWDGIRALDYLLSRPEVDPAHVGVTGNSGGGTLTTWLVACDQRFTMAAPGCYVTTWRHNAQNELPADAEQQPPLALAEGLDVDDFLALHAPKPLMILSQEKDFFDQRGTVEVFERLKRLYRLLGAPGNVRLFTGPDHHGMSLPLRQAMYGFFDEVCGRPAGDVGEDAIEVQPEEALRVTPQGQLWKLGSRTVFDFTAEKSRALAASRKPLSGDALRRAVAGMLKLPRRRGVPEFRILRALFGHNGPLVANYAVETEPGIEAMVYKLEQDARYSRPAPGTSAVLYLPHVSSDQDLRGEKLVTRLAKGAEAFFMADVRGLGESTPNTCGEDAFFDSYGSDYFYASFQYMLGEPYVGQRVHDVLCVLDWLESFGYADVHLAGRGWGSIVAAFAAVLDDRVTQVTLKNAPLAFSEWAENRYMRWPFSSVLPAVLFKFDLPDCYTELAVRGLRLIQPWDAQMRPLSPARAVKAAEMYHIPTELLKRA